MPVEGLTEPVLRRLYLEERLPEAEIARRFDTYQVQVNRLRRKYGIPTITKTARLNLPPLTPRQRSLLVGSMLGDGRLFQTGPNTAAFSEHHSLSQEPYLRWKAGEWGPYVKSIRPSDKVVEGKTYPGKKLRLHGCKTFRPYWERFYPQGSGNKTFEQFPRRLTALALAIWYLDDGSKTWNGYIRLSVSPSKVDQDRCMQLLERLGLNPRYYENRDGSDPSIWIHDRTTLSRFLDLVTPHVPECMAYKVDLRVRKRGAAPRDRLTEPLLRSFASQGWGATRIAKAMTVSEGAVQRAMDRFGIDRPRSGRPRLVTTPAPTFEGVREMLQRATLADDDLVGLLVGLPHPPPPSVEEAQRDWGRLLQREVSLAEEIRLGGTGLRLCAHCFPYRYEARYRDLPSLRDAWFDPIWVGKAIHFQRRVGDPVYPMNVHRALRAILRTPTNFRPLVAKAVASSYCPPGGLVVDPCAGYGGRAAGVRAAGRRYLGVEPHPLAPTAYQQLQAFTGPLQLISSPFEQANIQAKPDLVFTSPPYFSTERYSDDTAQSWVQYPTWQRWVEGFLEPLVTRSWDLLESGGVFAINTKDLHQGRQEYPILTEVRRLADLLGFRPLARHSLRLGYLGKTSSTEPLDVFRKPLV